MSSTLKHAFEEAAKLPKGQQEAFAAFLLAELADDRQWQGQFEQSETSLKRLASEALAEQRAGKTKKMSL